MKRTILLTGLTLFALPFAGLAQNAKSLTVEEATQALKKAVRFFHDKVALHDGYLWQYSGDLKLREGEGTVTSDSVVWVQPPGTPTVGLAYVDAYEATKDADYLQAAKDTARALIRGQLKSGGWTYSIEFDPAGRKKFAYRIDANTNGRNYSTLDDDTTQAALRFLMRLDQVLGFKDETIHEAAEFALTGLLKAQYANGAWPQGFDRAADPNVYPVKKASYPETWPKTMNRKDYWIYCTLNDNCLASTTELMLLASKIYGQDKYRAAAEKAGDFLILAQMPDPQPAWAQQYDLDMYPSWARKFEPPSITGGESQSAMEMLMMLYRETKNKKYLEPIPKALAYLNKSLLPDGRLARFYELETNKPLYFTRQYELTHKNDDLPTHYGFIVGSRLKAIETEYTRLKDAKPEEVTKPEKPNLTRLQARARAVVDALDQRGAWVEKGTLRFHKVEPESGVIGSRTFADNVQALSQFLAASR